MTIAQPSTLSGDLSARAEAVAAAFGLLKTGYEVACDGDPVAWYDRAGQPARLHALFDRLDSQVTALAEGRAVVAADYQAAEGRPADTLTSLAARFNLLVARLRHASRWAAGANDWPLATTCAEFARQFQDTLWDLAAHLHQHWGERETLATQYLSADGVPMGLAR